MTTRTGDMGSFSIYAFHAKLKNYTPGRRGRGNGGGRVGIGRGGAISDGRGAVVGGRRQSTMYNEIAERLKAA